MLRPATRNSWMIPPRGRNVKADSSMFLVGGGGRDNSKIAESVDKAEDM